MKNKIFSAPLCFPEKVLDQHLVVLGKTGAGKSSALRHVVEHLLSRGKRVCVVDPKGDWWGLKAGSDGKSAGFPVIMFGDFKESKAQDVPINARSGQHIAELVAGGNRPCVIGMRGWTQSDMIRFWIDFASSLFSRNSGELYIVGDEFHNFAPKGKILSPEVGKSIHWSNRLLSEGRGLGMVCLLASQRPQKVHNDTLTSCETLVAMRVIHKADRDAVRDWIDGNGDPAVGKEVLASLAGMPRGTGWVWTPEIKYGPERVSFPIFTTFDSFAPPQLQRKVSTAGWADVNLDQVKEKLAAVIDEAKANDPAELRRQLAAAKAELAKTVSKPAVAPPQLAVPKPVVSDKQIAEIDRLTIKLDAMLPKAMAVLAELTGRQQAAHKIGDSITDAVRMLQAVVGRQATPAIAKPVAAAGRVAPPAAARPVRDRVPSTDAVGDPVTRESLSGPEKKIIDAIAWLNSIGVLEPEQTAVAFLAGYTYGGGGFNNPRGALKTKGLVEYLESNLIKLTESGSAAAKFPAETLTQEKLHEKVMEVLPGPEKKLLKPLLAAYPGVMTNDALAAAAGYTNGAGGYNNPRGRLRTLGLIEYRDGGVAARSILFPG